MSPVSIMCVRSYRRLLAVAPTKIPYSYLKPGHMPGGVTRGADVR